MVIVIPIVKTNINNSYNIFSYIVIDIEIAAMFNVKPSN